MAQLHVKNLKKSFGGVQALKHIDFTLAPGSIHALCGGNGAGKSTFLSILMGFYPPTCGEIYLKGKKVHFRSPKEAYEAGICIVQQELSLIPHLSVAENIYLGQTEGRWGFTHKQQLFEKAEQLLKKLNIHIKPHAIVHDLSVAAQQLVEIAKALSHDKANIIIFDEPTSAIGQQEAENLFHVIRKLAASGKSIIYVSHRMDEIFEIASDYSVFRDGYFIASGKIADVTRLTLIEYIIGQELEDELPKTNGKINTHSLDKNYVLEVKNISAPPHFYNISFGLKPGEILGIYGATGSGRSQILDSIYGITKLCEGEIFIRNKKQKHISPAKSIQHKIAYVTEDRRDTGLILSSSIKHNITLSSLKNMAKAWVISDKKEHIKAQEATEQMNIKTDSVEQLVQNLSGGNQQKVVLARCLQCQPNIFLLDEPTRGIDVGAKKEIYNLIVHMAQQGGAVILVSSELSEIIGLCNHVLVLKDGHMVTQQNTASLSQKQLLDFAV